MKGKTQTLVLVLGLVMAGQAQAGWFDWFTPGEWFEGSTGLYAGGGLNVMTARGLLDRRLGGDGDGTSNTGNDTPDNDIPQFRINEPGYNTVLELRGGWQPLSFLAVEARYGLPLDSDEVENADNTQRLKLDSTYGIYVKPRLNISDSISLVGSIGYSDFDYSIKRMEGAADENAEFDLNGNGVIDGDFERGDSDNREFTGFGDGGFSWGGAIVLKLTAATRLSFEYNQYYDDATTMSDVDPAAPNPNRNRPASQGVKVYNIGFNVTYLFGQEVEDDYYY